MVQATPSSWSRMRHLTTLIPPSRGLAWRSLVYFFLNIFFTLKYFFFTLIPPSRGLAWRSLVYFVVVAVFAYFSCFSCVCRILCGVELCVCVCKYACMCECVTYVCTYIYTQNGAIYTWMHYMCTRQRARARARTHTHTITTTCTTCT